MTDFGIAPTWGQHQRRAPRMVGPTWANTEDNNSPTTGDMLMLSLLSREGQHANMRGPDPQSNGYTTPVQHVCALTRQDTRTRLRLGAAPKRPLSQLTCHLNPAGFVSRRCARRCIRAQGGPGNLPPRALARHPFTHSRVRRSETVRIVRPWPAAGCRVPGDPFACRPSGARRPNAEVYSTVSPTRKPGLGASTYKSTYDRTP